MIIIFPMAGLSSRFAKAGYTKPKYMLDLKGNSVFFHAINGFKKYFNEYKFIFSRYTRYKRIYKKKNAQN